MKRIFNGSGGRKTALILSLCLIFALAVGTTFALLKANTEPVTNTFTAAKSGTDIVEKLDGSQKKSIVVKNTGTAVSYVRVKLVMNWVDESGNVSAEPVNITPSITDDWFEQGGIYYYTKPVAANGETTNLLQTPITQGAAPEGYHLEVTVLAESIQAAPSTAVQQSWGVGVDSNGYLTQPTTTP
jgi:hypothetical protein